MYVSNKTLSVKFVDLLEPYSRVIGLIKPGIFYYPNNLAGNEHGNIVGRNYYFKIYRIAFYKPFIGAYPYPGA